MPRLRAFTHWTGTLLSALIAVALVVSARWQIAFQVPTSRGPADAVNGGMSGAILDNQRVVVFVAERGQPIHHRAALCRVRGRRHRDASRPAILAEAGQAGTLPLRVRLRGNVSGVRPEGGVELLA